MYKPDKLKVIVSEDGALYLDKITEALTIHHGKGKEPVGSETGEWNGAVLMVLQKKNA